MTQPASTSNRLVLLGTGTCQLSEDRRASSVLVEIDGLRVVYDLGRGIADRIACLGIRQDDLRHVVFSHFHPDHVSDLIPWLQAAAWSRTDPRTVDLHLWGPRGLAVQMHRLLGLFEVDNLSREHWRVHVHEVRTDHLTIEDRRFDFVDLPPAGNRGLRFTVDDRTVALTGDSSFHEQEIDFLRDVDIAIFDAGHLDDDEIIELAARANPKTLIASHLYRSLDRDHLEQRAREKGFTGSLWIGFDGQELSL